MTEAWQVADPYKHPCMDCERMADERVETVWTQVLGWEKRRKAGGTNHLALREPQNQFMCDRCMRRRQNGIPPGQETLL